MVLFRSQYRISIEGLVQGVGFRPFLFRLAQSRGLKGWVMNTGAGLAMEVSGLNAEELQDLLEEIRRRKPLEADIQRIRVDETKYEGAKNFEIRESLDDKISTLIPQDLAICQSCRSELFEPHHRLYQYPFISCSACGPRFTIMKRLPFDRAATSMTLFPLCDACRAEFSDPGERRFHAQTISCHQCGPTLKLFNSRGDTGERDMAAIREAVELLKKGGIVALKGVGGYQLAADARIEAVVDELRLRKRRPEKPLALMFPDLSAVRSTCEISAYEESLLASSVAPILLLGKRETASIAPNVSFDLPLSGVMLPNSPLHLLLLSEFGGPLVMTSANLPEQPMIIDESRMNELHSLADMTLSHDRQVVHRADDSLMRVIAGKALALRRGRGLAPYTLDLPSVGETMLAWGGQQKNTFSLQVGSKLIVSQHIGDLSSGGSCEFLEGETAAFCEVLGVSPDIFVHDLHPDYHSTHIAGRATTPKRAIQHHRAHVFACAAEHIIRERALACAWDGAGFGEDGRIWGGECYIFDGSTMTAGRIASFFPFPLIGGDKAAREPWRSALSVASVLFGPALESELRIHRATQCLEVCEPMTLRRLLALLRKKESFPETSSVARLFDAVAAFLSLRQIATFEGQAAMLLEGSLDPHIPFSPYSLDLLSQAEFYLIDWRPALLELLHDIKDGLASSVIAAKFHHTLIAGIERLLQAIGSQQIMLSGGVFQNAYLVEMIHTRAKTLGYRVLSHSKIPPNDGGISVGQIFAAIKRERRPCV